MAKAPVQAVDLDQPDRRSLLDALDASLRENGVVLVRMTAVQRRVKDRALDAARAFFGLPREEKMAVQAPQGAGNACLRGYVPYGSSLQRSTDVDSASVPAATGGPQARTPDRKESFTVGVHGFCDADTRTAVDPADDAYFGQESADGRLFAHNRWPDGTVGGELRAAWRAYFEDAMEPLARSLYDLMAEVLGIDAAVFRKAHSRHFSECRCNHYLAVADRSAAGQAAEAVPAKTAHAADAVPAVFVGQRRISAHKDFTDFTILAPDPHAAYAHLQIAARGGDADASYRMVPYDATCFVVLLGRPVCVCVCVCVDKQASRCRDGAKTSRVNPTPSNHTP